VQDLDVGVQMHAFLIALVFAAMAASPAFIAASPVLAKNKVR